MKNDALRGWRKKAARAPPGERGFSFMLDAFIATVIFIAALAFIVSSMVPQDYSSTEMAYKQIANDMLKAGIDSNAVQDLNGAAIGAFFSAYLPAQYDYRLEVKRYALSGGAYVLVDTNTFGNQTEQLGSVDYAESKKLFYSFSGSAIAFYNSAKLDVWVKTQ